MIAPRAEDESERLAALHQLGVLDTPPDLALDELVRLAGKIFDVPIALVSLVDEDRQWFKARIGLDVSETPRNVAFCAHAIMDEQVMEIADAAADARFRDNPLVLSDPSIRFYAGAPLKTSSGHKLGTLCVIDRQPRRLSEREREILVVLSRAVVAQLELGSAVRRANQEMSRRHEIEDSLRRSSELRREMHAAESDLLMGHSLSQSFDRALARLLELTQSDYGFIGEILSGADGSPYLKTHAITNIAWSEETRRLYDEHAAQGMEFTNLKTLFGAVVTSGATVIANQPATDSRRGGLPPGHPALNCFLGVPFKSAGQVTGMVGVSNRPGGYEDAVVEEIQPILDACATMVSHAKLQRERKKAEAALRQSEARYRLVVENSLDALIGIDDQGRIQSWGRQAQAIFGWTDEEACGADLSTMIVPERFRAGHRAGMKHYRETGKGRIIGRRIEMPALRRSGEEIPVELTVSAVETESGVGFSAFLRDISDRRNAENALKSTSSRLSALIRNLGAGLLVEDQHRRILLANDALCEMFGIEATPDQLVGADCAASAVALSRLFDDPAAFLADIEQALAGKTLVRGREMRMRDGRVLERDFIPIYDEDSYLGHMWQYHDVSARKRAEQEILDRGNALSVANAELSRASRLKDEFMASMSHELRTPLNAVLGLSECLRTGVFGPMQPMQIEQIGMIEDSGRHLLGLINDVLDLSKISAGKLEMQFENVSVQQICDASLRMVREAALRNRLRVETSLDGALVQMRADPLRLKQILVNLLSNAVKFTAPGGTVGLSTRLDAATGEAQLQVWDTGIGISAEDLGRLFKPFVQLDSSLSRKHEGTGLGLALVRQLAELHGGSVRVDSTPGRGSRFTIALPVGVLEGPNVAGIGESATGQADSREPGVRPQGTVTDGPLVLLAEDHEINIRTMMFMLQSEGWRVAVARNGREAVEIARERLPALILMDIQMPEMDGLTAIALLRAEARTAAIPIIALTALAMPGDRERCLKAGADEYLSKPVGLQELSRMMRYFTANAGPAPAAS